MKTLYYTSGISGSGKDFYLYNNFLVDFTEVKDVLDKNKIKLNDLVVCPDDIRHEILGNVNDQSNPRMIFDIVKKRLYEKLDKYDVAIFNSVNTSKSALKFVRSIKTDLYVMIVFKPNIELSSDRIQNQIENNEYRSNVSIEILNIQYNNFKRIVIGDEFWNGIWDNKTKNKISSKFEKYKVKFID